MFAICLLVMEQSGRGSNSPHPVLPFLPLKTPQRPAQLASAFPLPFSLSIPFASRSVSSSAGPRRCAPTRRCRTRRPRSTGLSAAVVDFPSAEAAPRVADLHAGEGLEPPDVLRGLVCGSPANDAVAMTHPDVGSCAVATSRVWTNVLMEMHAALALQAIDFSRSAVQDPALEALARLYAPAWSNTP